MNVFVKIVRVFFLSTMISSAMVPQVFQQEFLDHRDKHFNCVTATVQVPISILKLGKNLIPHYVTE